MTKGIRDLSLTYAAGTVGGLVNSVAVWAAGVLKLTAALGVKIAPVLSPGFLYPRLVWGGLWGFLFLLPFWHGRPFLRGIIFSLPPTMVQLFYVFPFKLDQGVMGTHLGQWTPLVVFLLNAIWGLAASYWLSAIRDTRGR
jgi:hypothetical protein